MGSITIGTNPVALLGAGVRRMNCSFHNRSAAGQIIYLDNNTISGLTKENVGYVLTPGQSLNFVLAFDGDDIKLPWSAVASASGAVMYVKEMTDYSRGV